MNKYRSAILIIIIFSLFISATFVLAAIDPGSWYYEKTVNLATGGSALISFPQATSDNGEGNHHLIGDPSDPNSLFENYFTNAQSGMFYLFYDGNDTVDEEILMISLGEDYDDYFFLSLKWQINDDIISQNISLESADFNSNEYGYYPQWWKVAQSGKSLISSGSDQDTYYVIYVKLGFDGQVLQDGDILKIKYALNGFDAPNAQLIFNVYGSSDTEDSFRWTNNNTNTFGVNSQNTSSQQNYPFYPYFYGGNLGGFYGGFWPGGGYSGYGGWSFTSPTGPVYGIGFGLPFSYIGGGYGSSYGFLPYNFSSYYPSYNSYYPGYSSLYGSWSSPFYGFSGGSYGGGFSGFSGYYNSFSSYYPGRYYGNFSGFYSFF